MWFSKSIEQTINEVKANPLEGLTFDEAKHRLEQNGYNRLASKKNKTLFHRFLSQINDAMIYILIIAALISLAVNEISDSIIIIIVILLNASIGVFQESKAEKAVEALKKLSTPKAVVKRDSELVEIPSEEVVVGDIVIIDAGRYIPADLRLIETANLKIDESAFTGESLPSDKNSNAIIPDNASPIGDRINMAFMSTLATYGRGIGVAVSTGMNTEIGHIATLLEQETKQITPLQMRLSRLGKILGYLSILICTLIFVISYFQQRDLLEMLLVSISLAVAAIPEGLPAIVAIVLALGVQRMIKENAIIKKLPSVETLGSVNIICSDKTGTLTINQMTVKKAFINYKHIEIDRLDLSNNDSSLLLEGMILCNDATSNQSSKTGDPTEIALLDAGTKFNLFKDKLNTKHKRVNEIPFDSDRKLMTTVNSYNNVFRVFTKGAIDSLLKKCTKILINGEIQEFTNFKKDKILTASDIMSDEALRVLALAYKDISDESISIDKLENELIFVGFVGMIDPPRIEVKDSINLCKLAGIKPIMITGDHKKTAYAIGSELNIADDIYQCISGNEIDSYSQQDFNDIVDKYRIFARVSPEHKVKIVKAFKANQNIVAMTGDGVNDAPSLKAADIGVAMGITGTDVAKGAADMILTDDNFKTIVKAVEEGRSIYNNIKKAIIFLLTCNFGEIIALFTAILLGWPTPLLPIHILWVNLITDSLPALSLGVDPTDHSVMKEEPRNPDEGLFSKKFAIYLITNGLLIGVLTLVAFNIGQSIYSNSLVHSQTIAFLVLSLSQLFFSLSIRSTKKSILSIGLFSNRYLIGSIILGIFIQFIITSIPALAELFKVFALSASDWGLIIGISIIPLIFNEIIKSVLRHFR
jgi:Ca2+-transporting ATPase